MPCFSLKTFGCQMNHSDSERVESILEKAGFTPTKDNQTAPDLLIVNTCSVRQKSEDKAHGFIVEQKKRFPHAQVAVTGCMVRQTGNRQNSEDQLLRHQVIDLVFRIEDAARLPKLLESHFPNHDWSEFAQAFGSGSLENYFHIVPKVANKRQVFVPIMQGCDKFCSFCIVPLTRGRELSRPLDQVVEECRAHVEGGAVEITLLGQNVNSYRDGAAGEKCFAKLLRAVDQLSKQGLNRLRFTSAHPQDFTDDVITALQEMRTSCPYVHLPVQHGANSMLRKMNRNYTVEQYETIIKKLRSALPQTTLATDIIVGFPGETKEEFEQLCDFARRLKFDFSYTAIYSPRKNTPAGRLVNQFIDRADQKRRFHIFDEIIKKYAWKNRARYVGQVAEVLVEKSNQEPDGSWRNQGRSREFFEVWFSSARPQKGQLIPVRLTAQQGYVFSGEEVQAQPKAMVSGLSLAAV